MTYPRSHLVSTEEPGTYHPGLFMTQPTATAPDPTSATFRSVANPHRRSDYASGSLGRETPHLQGLEPSRYVWIMNNPGSLRQPLCPACLPVRAGQADRQVL